MISVDTTDVMKELEQYLIDLERKLKRMVEGFAYEIALTASSKTPIGDPENGSFNYVYEYEKRFKIHKIPIEAGYHKGAWQYSTDGNFIFNPNVTGSDSGYDAANNTELEANAKYQVGQKFYIGAIGPGYAALEDNSSAQTNGQGILKPTLDSIAISYKIDLKRYFDKG